MIFVPYVPFCGSFLWLINPDIVDFHSLRPDRVVDALCAAPVSADRDVEEQVKRLVERPLFVISRRVGEAFVLEGEVELLVDVCADFFGVPFNRIDVEFARGRWGL